MEKMETIDGFQIAADLSVEIFGTQINVESQSLEVTEKPAPPGTYSIPEGYAKKDISFIKDQINRSFLCYFCG